MNFPAFVAILHPFSVSTRQTFAFTNHSDRDCSNYPGRACYHPDAE